jgi:hypothetical protein
MRKGSNVSPDRLRKKKVTIGIIAIALLLLFTILAVLGKISSILWILLDLAVAIVANLLLRRIGN